MKLKKTILLAACMVAILAETARGQAYEHMTLDVGSAVSVLNNTFTRNWDRSPDVHLGARVDYHAGKLEAGVRYAAYNAGNSDYGEAGFSSYFVYIGWEYPVRLTDQLTLAPGLRFGNNFMAFDNSMVYPPTGGWGPYPFDSHESEFAYELFTRLEYTLAGSPWLLHTSFAYNRTLTYHPLPVGLISFGVSRSFGVPSWLKNLLQ
ncbi:MAG TPA: hypothetical protein VK074_03700 [Fodinibius sp.]|nr:hypothetical protein [Fodinibius sp.]